MSAETFQPHTSTVGPLLPRELTDGVYWLGDCFVWPAAPGAEVEHAYTATYFIAGTECSMLVDTGHPNDWLSVSRQIDDLLDSGAPDLRWIFPTHPEVTHSGNLGRLLTKYPRARMIGNTLDFHLIFPDFVDRFDHINVGDEIDLGNRPFVFVEAVFRDLLSSVWGYDRIARVLFCADGLGFGHYHAAKHCGMFTEEIADLDIEELTREFMESALYWSRLKSPVPNSERLQELIRTEFPVQLIAPAHGSPIMHPSETVPRIIEAMAKMADKLKVAEQPD
jgi:flavorubredoxin